MSKVYTIKISKKAVDRISREIIIEGNGEFAGLDFKPDAKLKKQIDESYEAGDRITISEGSRLDNMTYDNDLDFFARNPSVDSYLAFREKYPEKDPNTNPFTNLDLPSIMEREYKEYGLDLGDICGALDGEIETQDKLSLALLREIKKANDLKEFGETAIHARNLAMPPNKIDFLIVLMLRGMAFSEQPEICNAFNFLLRVRLGEFESLLNELTKIDEKMEYATRIGGYMLDMGIEPTFRKVAKVAGIQPSTISRWFSKDEFAKKCEFMRKCHFEPFFLGEESEEDKEKVEYYRNDPLHKFLRAQHHK